jgi:hypothetical protein
MNLAKKQRELVYFDLLREVYEEIPHGTACVQERPDFVVDGPAGRIGIEITRYFRPTASGRRPLQEQFSLQHQIAQRAQREFARLGGEQLSVQIVFRPGVDINKSDVVISANELANALATVAMTETLTRIDLANYEWPTAVLSVYARKCLGRERSHWRPATAAWVRRLGSEDIQQEIVRKEGSLGSYGSELSEVWLLIVADGSAFVELSDEARTYLYRAQFDRVLFLDVFSRKCTRFEVQRMGFTFVPSPGVA